MDTSTSVVEGGAAVVEGAASTTIDDMGYEDCAPAVRRGSMTVEQEKQRRASIKAVLADATLSPTQKRRSIQHLMDGRRQSMSNNTNQNGTNNYPSNSSADAADGGAAATAEMMGYGTAVPDSATNAVVVGAVCNEQTKQAERQRPHCTHYERNCTMIAPCCGAAFGCRICHDDCPTLPPKINNGGKRFHRSASLPSSFTSLEVGGGVSSSSSAAVVVDATTEHPQAIMDNHHSIDRFAVREVICRQCYTRQSSKTNRCVQCGIQFGAYHCNICNLWMSDEEGPYHCTDCGFCRVGGRDNFQHCHQCGMCIDKTLYQSHNCKAGKYRSNCPVCQEYLFSSRGASHEMPCGHAIHWDCFRQMAAHDSRCPVCKKTAETRERMMPTWNAMAAGVAMQPVPAELARVVSITCNDCEGSEESRAWHFLGMQCSSCSSFNTVVDRIVLQGQEAHDFIVEINKQQRRGAGQQEGGADDEVVGQARQQHRRRFNRRRSAF